MPQTRRPQVDRVVRLLLDGAIAVVFAAVLATFWRVDRASDIREPSPRRMQVDIHAINAARHLRSINEADWDRFRMSFVLILSSTCQYCTQSAPLYKRLLDRTGTVAGVQVVALFAEPADQGRVYLHSLGVPIQKVFHHDVAQLGVPGTPTILLADSRGDVTRVWTGVLTSDQEHELLRSVDPGEKRGAEV